MNMLHDPDVEEIHRHPGGDPEPAPQRSCGRIVIRICDDVVDRMHGQARVREAFCSELGIDLGETTPDGNLTVERTPCIGMSDQAPAALVNDVVVTRLTPDAAREIVRDLRTHLDPRRLTRAPGRGHNAHELVRSMVRNHIQTDGLVLLSPVSRGEGLRRALLLPPAEVIREIETARLRGRGGSGWPCGPRWERARVAARTDTAVVATVDDAGPGTFKDRVLLTEFPDRVFAGMTIAGHAIGATRGLLCLRREYAYLRAFLEHVLDRRRLDGLLGSRILGRQRFSFDIEIRSGVGTSHGAAYGHEGGDRAACLDVPACVNDVETLCCATKILEDGAAAFTRLGTQDSTGTKLLSIAGDCRKPGVFEVPFGISLREVLDLCGGENAIAVQVGGPAGRMVGPDGFGARFTYEDLVTGGSVTVFGPGRNLLAVVHAFLTWFESRRCATCTSCRAGVVRMREGLERFMAGRLEPEDLEQVVQDARVLQAASRCRLGRVSPRPLLTAFESLPALFESGSTPVSRRLRRPAETDEGNA